ETQCTHPDTCDGRGQCQVNNVADNTRCDDGNICTIGDRCQNGLCLGSPGQEGRRCDDGNACTSGDHCMAGVCVSSPAPDGTSCDDGRFCTSGDTCQGGRCRGGASPCTLPQICSEGTGQCTLCGNGIIDPGEQCD